MASPADVPADQTLELENIFGCVCDLNGVLRGKRMPAEQIDKVLAGSVRMPLSICGLDICGEDIEGSMLVFETGDADGVCVPTGRGIMPLNWTSRPTALVPLWMNE